MTLRNKVVRREIEKVGEFVQSLRIGVSKPIPVDSIQFV
jgi:hypothetical protein